MATITNQAALSYNGITTLSNIAVGELVEVLTVTKTAADTTYTPGSTKTYAISLVNSGAAAFTGLTITDTLGSYAFNNGTLYPLTYTTGSLLYYVNGILQATPAIADTAPLTVTGLSVPAGGSAMRVYSATVNEYAPLGVEVAADEVFVSWGAETVKPFTEDELERILTALDGGEDGAILRAKGIVAAADGGQWLHYDFVPEEHQIRRGPADYTGRLCVIGSGLKEDKLQELFGL